MLCPKCNQEVTGKYCSFCGTPLEPTTSDTVPDTNPAKEADTPSVHREIIQKQIIRTPKKSSAKTKSSQPGTKVRKKKKRSILSTTASVTSGGIRSVWKLFILSIQWITGAVMLLSALRLMEGFWASRTVLGSISKIIAERNYAQGIFLIGAVCITAFALIQALWIITRKKMPDQGKVRRIDMGRGFFGFCMILLLILAARYVNPWIPGNPAPLLGVKQIFSVITGLGNRFFILNLIGIILCVIRKTTIL